MTAKRVASAHKPDVELDVHKLTNAVEEAEAEITRALIALANLELALERYQPGPPVVRAMAILKKHLAWTDNRLHNLAQELREAAS